MEASTYNQTDAAADTESTKEIHNLKKLFYLKHTKLERYNKNDINENKI